MNSNSHAKAGGLRKYSNLLNLLVIYAWVNFDRYREGLLLHIFFAVRLLSEEKEGKFLYRWPSPIYPIFFYLILQGLSRDAEQHGCLGSIPLSLLQGLDNSLALHVLE